MSRCARALLAAFLLGIGTPALPAQPATQFDLPSQPLAESLKAVGIQAKINVISKPSLVDGRQAPALKATATPQQALAHLLADTGLEYQFVNDQTVVIRSAKASADAAATKHTAKGEGQERPLALAQAQAQNGSGPRASATIGEPGRDGEYIEEILVTAQKRLERLQDVPMPVTSLNAASLIESGQLRLQDYYTRVPGLNLTTGSGSQDAPILSIRGVTTGGTGFGANPTVAILVDDVPYGSSTSFGGGNLVPDLDPGDLARIEVLRGPQGTLYGASSLGGLLKYETLAPSIAELGGRLQVGVTGVHHGDEVGQNFRGSTNVPLGRTVAIRASGFKRRDAGYLDDPGLGAEGVNRRDSYGGRLAGMWEPTEAFSLQLSALTQHSETGGSHLGHVLPGLEDLQQQYVLAGLGGYTRDSDVYGATLTADLGRTELVSISGYAVNDVSQSLDRTAAFGGLTQDAFGVRGAQFVEYFKTNRLTQEVRLMAPAGQAADWMLGVFYTREESDLVQDIEAVDPDTGASVGLPYHNPFESNYAEYAIFADLTYRFTNRFDLQIGGRGSRNEQDLSAVFEGVFMPAFFGFPSGHVYPKLETEDDAFTYLVTPRFRVTPHLMVYARFASGYRPGGPQPSATAIGAPPFFDPDTTRNYEIGAKGELFDRMLSVEASIFYIDWEDIQLQLRDPVTTFAYFGNGGAAKSQGIELTIQARPWSGTSLASWIAWNQAELTEDFPPGPSRGVSGDRLPFSARWSGNLSLDQEISVGSRVTALVGASVSYVGDRVGGFTANAVRQTFPSYVQADLRAGVRIGSWALDLFANNVADERGVLAGGLGTAQPFAFAYIQPRTLGLSVSKTF